MPLKLNQYTVGLPLALILGFLLATPDNWLSILVIGLVLITLGIPLFMGWHYPVLLFSWNSSLIVFFLPGQPQLWIVMAGLSLFLTGLASLVTQGISSSEKKTEFQQVPFLTWALVAVILIMLTTAWLRGGFGFRALGGESYGGKQYFLIIFAVVGYFAISANRIPLVRAKLYIALFFLGMLTLLMSNAIFMAGPNFYWLFNFFPVEAALDQVFAELQLSSISRLRYIAFGMVGPFSFLMARYGIRGIFDFSRPLRFLAWTGILLIGLWGGFRSLLILFALIFLVQFYFEGLFRTRACLILIFGVVLFFAILIPTSNRLPMSVQRTLSFLPLQIDPIVRLDAAASTEWRVRMWKVVWGEIPKYFLLGKGYAIDPAELYLVSESRSRGFNEDFAESMLVGNYHSGALSVLIPLGIFGTLAFVVFCLGAIRVLYNNYRHGEPALASINIFLLSCFIGRFIFYWVIFGDFSKDLATFCGLVGLGIALNGKPLTHTPQINPPTRQTEGNLFAKSEFF